MNRTNFIATCLVVFTLSAALPAAAAEDNVQVTVAGASSLLPTLKINGNDTIHGTIQLYYIVTDFAFPTGPVAQFTVNMNVPLGDPSNARYPAPLTLAQNGSQNMLLTPDLSTFEITGRGWTGSTTVRIEIPTGMSNVDGTELVGNLNMSVPGSNHVGTPTSIQVHILLVHPTACVKAYSFVTDADFDDIVTSTEVNMNKGIVRSSAPGQFGYNVLIANTCGVAESFDVQIVLDSRFETNPSNNPGNAVFTYATSGEVDPNTYAIQSFGTGKGQGQNLCLQNVTVQPNTSFLASVHSQVKKGIDAATLGSSPFSFAAGLRTAGANCTDPLDTSVSPNPVSTMLPFNVK